MRDTSYQVTVLQSLSTFGMQGRNNKRQYSLQQETLRDNIIKGTRRIIREMTETEKYSKAKAHILDALLFKHPRYDSQALETPRLFRVLYWLQLNSIWGAVLFFLGYLFVCLTALDSQNYGTKIGLESMCLVLFWVDILKIMYILRFDMLNDQQRYSRYFYMKFGIILLVTLDLFIFAALPCHNSRPIRPFRILRAFLPMFYDSQYRKNMKALASTYIEIISFVIFYWIIIVGFAIVANKTMKFDPSFKDPQYPQNVDPYKSNYLDLGRMVFLTYITATYDAFPDNQILAMQNYEPNFIIFIIFAFANMFLFSSIPGELIYIKFIDTRSKILLAEEINQEQSLILAFVTLAERDSNLPIDKLIKFLLFLYKYKIRYIEYITDICLRLDNNNNRSIQVNEFMQLGKILLQNEVMFPPSHHDIESWIKFRKYINHTLYFKKAERTIWFQVVISTMVILAFVNSILLMYFYTPLAEAFDTVFIWLFVAELLFRLIAVGTEIYFMEKTNIIDLFLILSGAVFFFLPISRNADGLIRMCRIFRVSALIEHVSKRGPCVTLKYEIYRKVKRIFTMCLEIMPIIIRFLSMYVFFFHIFGVAGMEFFYTFYQTNGVAPYKTYEQFSNWKTYLMSQYNNIAILYEAGWSTMANNHIARAPSYYAYIMLFLCLVHIIYVFILMNLIKGIFWEVYFTVDGIFIEREKETTAEMRKEEENSRRAQEINEINQAIERQEYIEPNTVIRRSIVQNKFDLKILRKLKNAASMRNSSKTRRMRKSKLTQRIINDWDIDLTSIEISQDIKSVIKKKAENDLPQLQFERRLSINQIEEIDQQDFEDQFSQLLEKILVNPKVRYHQFVASPRIFVDFLKSKFCNPEDWAQEAEVSLATHSLQNQQLLNFHVYEMRALLQLYASKREQKEMIIETLVSDSLLTEEQGEALIKKKLQEKRLRVNSDGVMRKVLVADINEQLISKLQVEFFSNLYGESFKRINKITLAPLLRLEAGLTYTLRNILRYPQINSREFFTMLTSLEDKASNNLLSRGSLFKFVYKLDHDGDIWFTIEHKRQADPKIHFIKSGLWCYHAEMQEKQLLFARDVFNWTFPAHADPKLCEKYMMNFYQGFESLALTLVDQSKFFQSNPKEYIYDLFAHYVTTEKLRRFKKQKLEVSRIMLVVLCKKEERKDIGLKDLDYKLTEIQPTRSKERKIDARLEDQDDTFEQLKNFNVDDVQRIVESEGLPFAYVENLIKEVTGNVMIYCQNFVFQVERLLNDRLQELEEVLNANVSQVMSLSLQEPKR